MVSKILKEVADSSSRMSPAPDIFADYYFTLLDQTAPVEKFLSVYPNPTETRLTIELKQPLKITKIQLTDIMGKLVKWDIIDNKLIWDVTDLSSVIYLIKGFSDDGIVQEVHTISIQ